MRAGLAIVLCLSGCVEKGEPERPDPGFIQDNLLSAAPTPGLPLDADLGGKVVYLGADVDKQQAALGDRVKITHYWKVVEPPGPEWRLFTHVNGSAGDWINVDDTRMRKGHGPDRWKAGEIIRDEQTFPILKTWKSPEATVYVGMFRKGGQTEKDRMPIVSGPSDGKGRLRVATISITGAAAAAGGEKPYVIRRARGPITLDGKADEEAWAAAETTGDFVDAEGGEPVGAATRARLLYDDSHLYVLVEVEDRDVATQYKKHDEPIWKEDAIELFIDADGNGKGYIELQVNPRGTMYDSWYADVRPGGDPAWQSGMKAAVKVDGTLDKRDDVDRGWTVELAIPLAAVKGRDEAMAVTLPPAPGDTWRLNLVRVEKPLKKGLTVSSWAPIPISDFHALDRLKVVTFGEPDKAASN
jgi:hypothetical protein